MPDGKIWTITTSPRRPLLDIARDLTSAGFKVEKILNEIGIITGRLGTATVEELRAVPDVEDVSPSIEVDIGPPGAKTTW